MSSGNGSQLWSPFVLLHREDHRLAGVSISKREIKWSAMPRWYLTRAPLKPYKCTCNGGSDSMEYILGLYGSRGEPFFNCVPSTAFPHLYRSICCSESQSNR